MGNVIKSRIIVEWAMEEPNWKNIRKIQHRIPSRFRLRIVENARPLEYIALSYNHCQNCCNKTDINIFSTCPPTFASPPPPPPPPPKMGLKKFWSWGKNKGGGGGGGGRKGEILKIVKRYTFVDMLQLILAMIVAFVNVGHFYKET